MSYQNPRQEKMFTGCSCIGCKHNWYYEEHRLTPAQYLAENKGRVEWGEVIRDEEGNWLGRADFCYMPKELLGLQKKRKNKCFRNRYRTYERKRVAKARRVAYRAEYQKVLKGLANEVEICTIGMDYTD